MSTKLFSVATLRTCNSLFLYYTPLFSIHYDRNTKLKPRLKLMHTQTNIKSAGIIVIGDEILKGSVHDTNSHYALKCLYKLGIKVKKVSVVSDDIDDIANEVKLFSSLYHYVLTTGGIGPTHDDVTFEAVAKAFNVKLAPNPTLVQIVSQFAKTTDVNAPGMKLAWVPETAKLTFGIDKVTGQRARYPNVSVQNVYIFPGIPQLFESKIDSMGEDLFQSNATFYGRVVYLNVAEPTIVETLNKLVKKYPDVVFGSYPVLNNQEYKVKLTLESTRKELVDVAAKELIENFPATHIVQHVSTPK